MCNKPLPIVHSKFLFYRMGEKPAKIMKLESGPGGCKFWNEKKKRFCKMEAKKGTDFCGQHTPIDGERTICDLCGTILMKSKTEKHMKKCNVLKSQKIIPKYYNKGEYCLKSMNEYITRLSNCPIKGKFSSKRFHLFQFSRYFRSLPCVDSCSNIIYSN